MSLHRLLGFRAAVTDPGALAGYYGEMGLAGDAASGYTGCDGGAAVVLDEAPVRRLVSVDVGCEDDDDLDDVRRRLEAAGASPRRGDDSVSALDPASQVLFTVRVAESEAKGAPSALVTPNAPGATTRVNTRAPAVFDGPRPPRRLGHLVIGTPDLAATRDFLVGGIGCKISDEFEGIIAFLRCSTDHHNIGIVGSPVPLLQHYSWECEDIDHVGHAATALYRAEPGRHSWGIGRHFAGSNFYWYLRDPAGSFVEFYSDMDQIDDDEVWESRGRTPFDLDHVANAWGPNLPLEFIEPEDLLELKAAWSV
jgi:catechol 2,3-dioxygenase-like lactoylglutathione lyase family enzyme